MDINLVELVKRKGTELKQRGNEWRGPCPLHTGKNPSSFVVRNGSHGQHWVCYSDCNDHGGPVKFVMKAWGKTKEAALEMLGLPPDELPDQPPAPPPAPAAAPPPGELWQKYAFALIDEGFSCLWSKQGERARTWLNGRGLTDETIKRWHLGYIPQDRFEPLPKWGLEPDGKKAVWLPRGILMPCVDYGKVWYLKIRRATGQPKTPQIKGSKPGLFGDFGLHKTAFIVEGEFDAMLLHQEAADLVGVGTTGAAGHLPKGHWIDRLLGLEHIFVVGDNDPAGKKHNDKWQRVSGRVTTAKIPAGNDITDYYQAGGDLRAWVQYLLAKRKTTFHPSVTSVPRDETHLHPPAVPYQTIIYPAGANIAVIGNQWHRLPDDRIKATYHDREELELSVTISLWVKEWDNETSQQTGQTEMFPAVINQYQMEG